MELSGKVAVVTGASAGFGEAIARALAAKGVRLALGARRKERLDALAAELRRGGADVFVHPLDVRETPSAEAFGSKVLEHFGSVDILVNNAGLALGRETLLEAVEADYVQMWQTNVLGVVRLLQRFVPGMVERKSGHIVNIGSIAGSEAYEKGGGYCSSKFALRAITRILRMETLGKDIRVTSIDPGMAETEFSLVRFGGDREKAKKIYEGVRALRAPDVAECVLFALERPLHVNVDEIALTSIDQAGASKIHRASP